MKGRIFGVLFLFIVVFSFGIVNAEDTCDNLGYECGVWDLENVLDCGGCEDGACIVGKCYGFEELGECVSFNSLKYGYEKEFSCKGVPLPHVQIGDSVENICIKYGCGWDENNPSVCTGVPKSVCSDLGENCLTSDLAIGCTWENNDIYTTKLYWKGEGISYRYGLSIDENSPDDINIPLIMYLKNSMLPEGTELEFDVMIVSLGNLHKLINKDVRATIESFVDKDGQANASWILSAEDLKTVREDSNNYLEFVVKKDGLEIFEYDNNDGNEVFINHYGTIEGIRRNPTNLRISIKKGTCHGDINCNVAKEKWECEEFSEIGANCNWDSESNSCGGDVFSCNPISDKETCDYFYDCSWERSSFWDDFIGWFKNLFS